MRTALVVGGTSGIGLASALRLQAAGDVAVHVAGRGKTRLDELATRHPEITTHRADGGDRDEIAAVAAGIGTLDWLVVSLSGNAGMGPIAELDLAMLRDAFEAKFWAHLTTVQACLPRLAPTGSITLVSAISARTAIPGTAGLAAINAAVEGLVMPLAAELAPIRVNAVSPGVVDTPWWDAVPEPARGDYFAQLRRVLPTARVATAEDVAEIVVLAATNPNITGTVIEADGGARLVSLG